MNYFYLFIHYIIARRICVKILRLNNMIYKKKTRLAVDWIGIAPISN